jgi:hypothetical protein
MGLVVVAAAEFSKAGQGEINTALGSVQSLVSVAMPLAWGWLCKSCFEGGSASRWFHPGGQFAVAALLRLVSDRAHTTPTPMCL